MKVAPLPCHGIYFCKMIDYRYKGFLRQFITMYGRCTVIKEFDKTYLIEIEEAVGKYLPGDRLRVRKRNVRMSAMDNQKFCHEYNLYPTKQSCQACLQRCAERNFT